MISVTPPVSVKFVLRESGDFCNFGGSEESDESDLADGSEWSDKSDQSDGSDWSDESD